jgi:mono/diheme cytochrome c family protein
VVKERQPGQLFWVVKHGIKMTGMPSFGAIGTDDKEIWSIVAFVKALPNVSEADYKAWTANP